MAQIQLSGQRRRASLDKEPEQLKCPHCKKPFSNERGMKIHIARYCGVNPANHAESDTG